MLIRKLSRISATDGLAAWTPMAKTLARTGFGKGGEGIVKPGHAALLAAEAWDEGWFGHVAIPLRRCALVKGGHLMK